MSNKAVKISNGTPFTDGERHLLQSEKAKYIHLNTGIKSKYHALHKPLKYYLIMLRMRACGNFFVVCFESAMAYLCSMGISALY